MSHETIDCLKILKEMQASWNAAAKAWNPSALARFYMTDALFYGGRPGHSVGAAEIEKYFGSYDGIIRSAVLDLIEQQCVQIGVDSFAAQGFEDQYSVF